MKDFGSITVTLTDNEWWGTMNALQSYLCGRDLTDERLRDEYKQAALDALNKIGAKVAELESGKR